MTTADQICGHIRTLRRDDEALACEFARTFFARVPRSLLEERPVAELGAMILGAWEFLKRARPDLVNVEVTDPRDEGWSAPVSVIRTEVGDRPFIVDTLREYLNAENIAILHYVYPVLRVDRGPDGAITALGAEASGQSLEALGHIEIPHVAGRERAAAIRAEVERRLTDVVEATRDFRAMVDELERVRGAVAGYVRRFADHARDYGEVLEFLGWLRQGNFVFLGYRAYEITGAGGEAAVRVEPGSGLGILAGEERSRYAHPRPLAELEGDLRARLTGGPPLLGSKGKRVAPRHPPSRVGHRGGKR